MAGEQRLKAGVQQVATRGQRPTPTALKLVRGNPGRRPINKKEFKPESGSITCPKNLPAEARKEFRRLSKVLEVVLTPADRSALAILCTSWARFIEAEQHLAKHGPISHTPNGCEVQSVWQGISNRAAMLHAKLCAEFGLTPCSRTRVNIPPPRKPEAGSSWGQFKKES